MKDILIDLLNFLALIYNYLIFFKFLFQGEKIRFLSRNAPYKYNNYISNQKRIEKEI